MPGKAPLSVGCTATARPPRTLAAAGDDAPSGAPASRASPGAATGSAKLPSSCASVACSTRTGTAAATSCVIFSRSRAAPSSAAASQAMLIASAGTATGHAISFAAPAASTTSCGGRAIGRRTNSLPPAAAGRSAVPCSVARTFISRAVVLRRVSMALKRSPSRTSGGRPASTCRSWVTRMLALPVPNFCTSASATATSRKLVSESLIGTATVASPLASTTMFAFQISSVSNSSRAEPRPPPPPAATAFRP